MIETPSTLSITAAGFYVLVAIAAAAACSTSRSHSQRAWHFQIWLALTVLFTALCASRLLSIEDLVRAELRDWLRAEGAIDGRRVWQGYAIAAAILVAVSTAFFGIYRATRRIAGRRNFAAVIALGCGAAMVALVGLRMISLHAMDALLYGPLKLNWVGDIGASGAVLVAAIIYVRLVRARP